ncbi:MAG TPA: hypothetical protein VKT77_13900 [Chthonomonadaceae bacterium]|nr:hypothetical protein [Chthonomonadaceae bacterium]
MTITIELSEELADRLAAAGIPETEASRFALTAIQEAADNAEVRDWWNHLSDKRRDEEMELTEESSAAGNRGRTSPADEVYARVRARNPRATA